MTDVVQQRPRVEPEPAASDPAASRTAASDAAASDTAVSRAATAEPEPHRSRSRRRDRGAAAVALVAAICSVAAYVHFYRLHVTLGYQDSYSHLEISRRIVVGKSTGVAQLGGIWLPVPHLLQAVFAWNWTLYRTGLAGGLVSMASYVACSVLIYRTIRLLTGPGRAWAAAAGAAVFMFNPNVLFQQSTSMDELPFYAFTLGAVYGLVRWAATDRAAHLLAASTSAMLAMLCRYEGWYLAGVYVVCVVVMSRRMGHSWGDVRGLALVATAFGVVAPAGGWLLYNWMIFGTPFNFLTGANSSQYQMARRHGDVEIGSWSLTLKAYGVVVESDLGLLVLAAAVLAFVVFVVLERASAKSLPVLGLCTIVPFFLYTLEAGQEPIGVPQYNVGLLNLRFGLVVCLPAALLIGYALARLPRPTRATAAVLTLAVLAGGGYWSIARHQVVTAQEASEDNTAQSLQAQAADYLVRHTSGRILVNLVGNERVAFPVLDRIVYEGTKDSRGNVYSRALKNPKAAGIEVIVMRTQSVDHGSDDVFGALHASSLLAAYQPVYHNEDYTLYLLRA